MSNATYEIIRDGETKTFNDESAWKDMQQLLDENDVDYETTEPNQPSADGGSVTDNFDAEADVVEHGESQQVGINSDEMDAEGSEGAEDTNDAQDAKDTKPVPDDQATDAAVVESVPDNPPERNLSDDPVKWFGDIGEFTYEKHGTTCINKKGLRVLQYWYEIDNPSSEVVVGPEETDHEFARVRAEVQMPDGRTAVVHGSAHVDRGDDSYLLTEMADTRAKSRVILDVTGMGAVAVSELENEL